MERLVVLWHDEHPQPGAEDWSEVAADWNEVVLATMRVGTFALVLPKHPSINRFLEGTALFRDMKNAFNEKYFRELYEATEDLREMALINPRVLAPPTFDRAAGSGELSLDAPKKYLERSHRAHRLRPSLKASKRQGPVEAREAATCTSPSCPPSQFFPPCKLSLPACRAPSALS
jgi:hypothetical protein